MHGADWLLRLCLYSRRGWVVLRCCLFSAALGCGGALRVTVAARWNCGGALRVERLGVVEGSNEGPLRPEDVVKFWQRPGYVLSCLPGPVQGWDTGAMLL